jgi:hypothetical protein
MIKQVNISHSWIKPGWPMANLTAPWHPINATLNNWIVPHRSTISYRFNHHGFRDKDQDVNGAIWCLGDSQTAGMGVEQHNIWSSLLENLTGIPTVNLGIAGASNDTISRVLCSALTEHRPVAICCLLTAPNRREIINNLGSCTVFPKSLDRKLNGIPLKIFEEFLFVSDPVSDQINYDKNLTLIKLCCQAHNVPLVVADFDQPLKHIVKNDTAEDGFHIGPATHKIIADFFNNHLHNHLK